MCLSTVYTIKNGDRVLMCKDVQSLQIQDEEGTLMFTDIIGMKYPVKGKILNIDLVGNTIDVKEE